MSPFSDRLIASFTLFILVCTFQLSAYGQSDSFGVPSSSTLSSSSPSSETLNRLNIDRESGGFLAEITVNSPEEVEQALKRAEQLFEQGAVTADTGPATFILYGPEASIFLKENYSKNKEIVDLAARLSAFKVVDIKVCEIHLGYLGRDKNAIHPFVTTVPYGPGEVDRLIKEENFSYF